jgi:hypothetical protein
MTSRPHLKSAQSPDRDGAGYGGRPRSWPFPNRGGRNHGARLQGQAISYKEFISAVQEVGALETARETEAAAKAALVESDRTLVVLPRHVYG